MDNTSLYNREIGEFYLLRMWKHNEPGLPIYPHAAEESRRIEGTASFQNYHEYFLVIFVTEGRISHSKGDQQTVLSPGEVLIVPPGLSTARSEGAYRKYLIGLAGCQIEQLFSAFKLNGYFKFKANIPETVKIYRRLFRKMHRKTPSVLPSMIGDCMELLAMLSLAAKDKAPRARPQIADQIRSTLEAECDNPESLAGISSRSGVPRTSLHRIFKDKFGTSPKRYQFECRMRQARDLLEMTDMSIKEIAARTGFQNQYYFSNVVKKEYALSPKDLRLFLRESKRDQIIQPKA